jgi:hypothetical protein
VFVRFLARDGIWKQRVPSTRVFLNSPSGPELLALMMASGCVAAGGSDLEVSEMSLEAPAHKFKQGLCLACLACHSMTGMPHHM